MIKKGNSTNIESKCLKYKDYVSHNNKSISEYVKNSIKNILGTLNVVEQFGSENNIKLAKSNAIVSLASVFEISWKMFFQVSIDLLLPQEYLSETVDCFLKTKINDETFNQLLQNGFSRGVICVSLFNFQNYKEIKLASKEIFGHDITTALNKLKIVTKDNINNKAAIEKSTRKKRHEDAINLIELLNNRHEIIHMAGDNLEIETTKIHEYSNSLEDYVIHSFFSFKIHGTSLIDLQAEKENP